MLDVESGRRIWDVGDFGTELSFETAEIGFITFGLYDDGEIIELTAGFV